MGNFWAIYAGFILGILARALLGTGKPGILGFVIPAVIGMVGAFAVDYAGQWAGLYGADQLNAFLAGILGAAILLAAWRYTDRRRAIAA